MILKPTRETATTTLIDKVFTNKYSINDDIVQCIFAYDISDRCMIFHISDKCSPDIEKHQLIRLVNESRITKYKEHILDTGWSILNECDTRETYLSSSSNIFECIYNESFPVIKAKGSTEIAFLGWLQGWRNLLNEKVITNFTTLSYFLQNYFM